MNYIKRLQAENAKLIATIENTNQAIDFARVFLASAKFTGTESDGSRKDWISTGDVYGLLEGFRDALTVELDACPRS